MTGQLVRENGIWSNRSGADPQGPSHVRNLRDAGFRTAVIGKTHLWRHSAAGRRGIHVKDMEHVLNQWGFDDCLELNDPIETAWMDCHYTDYLAEHGWLSAHRKFIDAWVAEMRSGNMTPWGQAPAPVPPGEDEDSFIGRRAVEWLQTYDKSNPFYLQVQFTGPHDPYDGPAPYRQMYDVEEIDPGNLERHEPPTRFMAGWVDRSPSVARATRYQKQRWRAWYYANVTLIDEWIGTILETLRAQGMLDNTWVIFNSDHGEMLGEHGMQGKAVFYQDALHVPCIMRPPNGVAGLRSQALVEQIDVPATILDIAGEAPLSGSLGRTLQPYLEWSQTDAQLHQGKDSIVSELFGQCAVVSDRYTLSMRVEDQKLDLMFDRQEDRLEAHNVIEQADYAKSIQELIDEFILPINERIDQVLLDDYRNYVKTTGSIN